MFENLNAFDVLEIALRVEANAVRFYEAAAKIVNEPETAATLNQLAQWEQGHIQVFSEVRERLLRQDQPKAALEARRAQDSDAQIMAGLAVFGIQPDPWPELTGKETLKDVLSLAIKKERQSVVFYRGLKGFVPMPEDCQAIERILQEELLHVQVLTDILRD